MTVAFWMAYEWGPGNETVTPWILLRILRDSSGAETIVVTAAVGFAFTTAQQVLSGLTALVAFSMFTRSANAAWQRLGGGAEWSTLRWPARAAIAFGLGTTAVALTQTVSTGQVGVKTHWRTIVQSAALCGSIVGMIGAVGGSLTLIGRNVPALQQPTERVLVVLASPLIWLGIATAILLVPWIRRRRQGAATS